MRRILYVAGREFKATVLTKGFIFGMLVTPALLGLLVVTMPRVMMKAPPKVEGRVAIVDPTGAVAPSLAAYLTPERFAERRAKALQDVERETPEPLRRQVAAAPGANAAMRRSLDAALGQVPHLELVVLGGSADVEQAKTPLARPLPKHGPDATTQLALVVIHPDAVHRADEASAYGTYDLFVRSKLDDRIVDDLHRGLSDAIVSARLAASGIDPARVTGLTEVRRPTSRTVTAEGEQATNQVLNLVLPAAFMALLLVSVLMSGQYLLTSTVEEKSSRVVEVLLSAVSPMELMTGKILGQMGVGFLILSLYAGLGLLALMSFAALGLIDPMMIVFLLLFYVLAYGTVGAMMAAIGSAVNEIREAQALMMPVMLTMMIPWILWLPISRDPNSVLAVVLSFVPPVGNFVMLLRMTSATPPPMWQAWLAVAVGAAGVYASLWSAAKVFRVGLLMFGKPPTFGTLVRWVRMS